jgi:hypothetical protein
MSKSEKLLEKIRNNPKVVSFEDLDKVLRECGFACRQAGSGSSHYVYTYGVERLTVPYKRPYLKAVYVKQALDILDRVFGDKS